MKLIPPEEALEEALEETCVVLRLGGVEVPFYHCPSGLQLILFILC